MIGGKASISVKLGKISVKIKKMVEKTRKKGVSKLQKFAEIRKNVQKVSFIVKDFQKNHPFLF